jgi:hypothetical protein
MGTGMKFILDTLMIFFATLAVAGLVALGEPTDATAPAVSTTAVQPTVSSR